ncbi:putative polyketide synthase [Stachybotrys elegans]|uniref:Polyketide synthase n=1 Tax=Stachybotrys elegans TaxID=80388 RepID=A0A8K0WIT5_9HYPO|nr:putative polyketide synthase [Stachybotrys elegans]
MNPDTKRRRLNGASHSHAQTPDLVDKDVSSDIAIVGFSFDFPEARCEDSFWRLILEGKNTASQFPDDRLSSSRYHSSSSSTNRTISPQKACFIERDIGTFDASFFGMSPEEAVGTDPQQRILLEIVYRALENAGIPMQDVRGTNTSVHTGCFTADYTWGVARDPEKQPKYAATGLAACMLSNRISTFFDLSGASVTIDTACSSSLVALDMACQSIREGSSSMGIVTGCNLLLTPDLFLSLSTLGFLSPDGVCHSFDNRANGYGRGEGFGALIIKPVEAAIRDGNTIRAVIRSTATNQNGQTALAHPSKDGQLQLIQDAYLRRGLDMKDTHYFEAHGTGTSVGDPLEATAIGQAFFSAGTRQDPMHVGSVKANIGHLEGAAGIAGIIKAIMVLEKGIIPPIANLGEVNGDIDAEFWKLKFPLSPTVWPSSGLRRASVNSFGFGGTNAHAVLDDALHYLESRHLSGHHCVDTSPGYHLEQTNGTTNGVHKLEQSARKRLFVWSADEKPALERMLSSYKEYLTANDATNLDDLAHTLNSGRENYSWRTFVVADSVSQLLEGLASPSTQAVNSESNLCFVFTGQGAQWLGMGRGLLKYATFRKSVLDADEILGGLDCPWKALDILEPAEVAVNINEPQYAQPLCTILQVALVELLRSFGIYPATAVGHSSGEIAAAFSIGALSQESAWKLSYYRGLWCSKLANSVEAPKGTMVAVALAESAVRPYIAEALATRPGGTLSVACINSTESITLAGDVDLVEVVKSLLDRDGIFNRSLKVPVAYHSQHMKAISSLYHDSVGNLTPGDKLPFYASMVSSVTGHIISRDKLLQPGYWVDNLLSPVKFSSAIAKICANATSTIRKKLDLSHRDSVRVSAFVEIGPHSTLQGPIRQTVKDTMPQGKDIAYLSLLNRKLSSMDSLLRATGTIYCLGGKFSVGKTNIMDSASRQTAKTLTDLPPYPFDHSKRFWEETRTGKNVRLQSEQYLDVLLGVPVADFNPLEPCWRNYLSVSSLPWMKDHVVHKDILFPAAGMCVMAIEAVAHMSTGLTITGYGIRDFLISNPLVIPHDGKQVEVQFRLRNCEPASTGKDNWVEFVLFACDNDDFLEICRGSVKAETSLNSDAELRLLQGLMDQNGVAPGMELSSEDVYARLATYGYNYGPVFQGIKKLQRKGAGNSLAEVAWNGHMDSHETLAFIHPSTLDSILQAALPAIAYDDINTNTTWLPTSIKRFSLWNTRFESPTDEGVVLVNAHTSIESARLCRSSIRAARTHGGTWALSAEGVEMASVTNKQGHEGTESPIKRLCYDMVYEPDLDLLDTNGVKEYLFDLSQEVDMDPNKLFRLLKIYMLASLSRTVAALDEASIAPQAAHLRHQLSWIRKTLATARENPPSDISPDWIQYISDESFEFLCTQISSMDRLGEIHVQFGAQLMDILSENINPLESLSDLITEYYVLQSRDMDYWAPLHRYLDAVAHKNPAIRVLEIGAGTGATTKRALDSLVVETANGPLSRFSQYDFTDVSGLFLQKASVEFANVPKMKFGTLDITKNISEQGFSPGSYDIVIAADVLHATPSLPATLTNVRRLLKDGGKLIVSEITQPEAPMGWLAFYFFGVLPGWWESQDSWRQDGPCATLPDWDRELKSSGFHGVGLALEDSRFEEDHVRNLIISTAGPQTQKTISLPSQGLVIRGWKECAPSRLSDTVYAKLRELGMSEVCLTSFLDAIARPDIQDALVVIAQDGACLSLDQLDKDQFSLLQTTFARCSRILWLTDTFDVAAGNITVGMLHGLARTLKMERRDLAFATVALSMSSGQKLLSKNVHHSLVNFLQGLETDDYEPELVQIGSWLHTPRVYESRLMDQAVHNMTSEFIEKQLPFDERPLQLRTRQPGLLENLYFEERPALGDIDDYEIDVDVKAVGMNFRDCLIALGQLDQLSIGSECSGVVARVGSQSRFQIGDRVLVLCLGVFQSKIRCSEQLAVKISPKLSFSEAAALPTNFVTAYHALHNIARLSQGETVLIHAGAGGTGQAAIQVAQWCGAEVFTTVGSKMKRELLINEYGVRPENILNSRDTSFAHDIQRLTNGRGVDVVLNSLSGDSLVASWECVAPYGRFVEIGKKDIFSDSKLPMFRFARNVSFAAVDIGSMADERPRMIEAGLTWLMNAIDKGTVKVQSPIKVFPISDVESAFRYLQGGANAGKVVVSAEPDMVVPAHVKPRSDWSFDPAASYLIAGGLGAQGRYVAQWMVSKGARHMILLSRSGPGSSDAVATFLEDLRSKGVTTFCPKCDIADAESLSAALEQCRERMPPIKGCLQATMVLRDGIFENLAYEAWLEALAPKVQGSWNLHQQLPKGLDLFVMFSSASGIIGSMGQSNYAAGNTYQDELARYRVHLGEKAVSVNFSLMAGAGFAADQLEAARLLKSNTLMQELEQDQIMAVLEQVCDSRPGRNIGTQLVLGLGLPSEALARGADLPSWMHIPMFSNLHQVTSSTIAQSDGDAQANSSANVLSQLQQASTEDERVTIISEALIRKICQLLSLNPESVDATNPLHVYGVDSLVAVELRNWLQQTLKVKVKVFEIISGATCLMLARGLNAKMEEKTE